MNSRLLPRLVMAAVFFCLSPVALADDASALRTITNVLLTLNHFPSDADKTALMAVANDESNSRAYRVVATAVHNFQHAATDSDKEALTAIMANARTTQAARELSRIVLELNHTASSEAKLDLQALQ